MFGTFFTITASDTASVIDYAGDLISDLNPLLLLIVGTAIGLFILWGIVSAMRH